MFRANRSFTSTCRFRLTGHTRIGEAQNRCRVILGPALQRDGIGIYFLGIYCTRISFQVFQLFLF